MASPKPPQKHPQSDQRYFFILGRETRLSAAEVASCLSDQMRPAIKPNWSDPALVLTGNFNFKVSQFMRRLGGTVKLGQILLGTTIEQLTATLAQGIFESGLLVLSDKVTFGISIYGDTKTLNNRAVVRLGMTLKNELNTAGYTGRFVNRNEATLSSVSVTKNNLIEAGGEIVLIVHGRSVLIGRTEAVQDFESYSRRDYGRPGRDIIQGMLPPKLAQIMINLTQTSTDTTLLDPFCGSGTVLQEAYLLGFTRLIGFDSNSKAVRATRRNIDWLKAQTLDQSADIRMETQDAINLSQVLEPRSVGVIVTEPYLGPIRPPQNRVALEKVRTELTQLYTQALAQFQKVLSPGGRVALIVPCWFIGQVMIKMPLGEVFHMLGFELLPFPKWVSGNPFLYHRPGQRVGREIYVLEKK